jgi:hypothetical protein
MELGFFRQTPQLMCARSHIWPHIGGSEAAAEFQKNLYHPEVGTNEFIGALAHPQIGRSLAAQSDTVKAKAAYQEFVTLRKNPDPDIPILKQAQAEYAKLQ